mmetsp:Transcript_16724/g.28529  ORF Transcript_16724/g.28529 Transcript_16724/m.28529 type:complete len:302 (+) Transcript_16724:1257-2162(+)
MLTAQARCNHELQSAWKHSGDARHLSVKDHENGMSVYAAGAPPSFSKGTSSSATLAPSSLGLSTGSTDRTITSKLRFTFHIAETQASVEGRAGLGAEDGELVIGLYGKAAPKAVENFLRFCVPPEILLDNGDVEKKPSLVKAQMWRMEPGVSVEVGRIKGLQVVPFAGSTALKYDNWLTPVTTVAEGNGLLHDRRGLLTRRPLNVGPAFEITLAEAPQLDRTAAEVFGVVLKDDGSFLEKVEQIPLYSNRAAESSGAFAGALFQAQKKVYTDMAKNLGDSRLEDQNGKLLRKIEVRAIEVI